MKRWKQYLAATTLLVACAASAQGAEPLNVNQANAAELAAAIPGVGMKKAEAIVAYREANGPFKTVEDLVKVRGIGTRTIEDSRDGLKVD